MFLNVFFLGIVATMGSTWQQNRRATLQILHDYGFGKTGMENTIKEEAAGLADIIRFPFFCEVVSNLDAIHLAF